MKCPARQDGKLHNRYNGSCEKDKSCVKESPSREISLHHVALVQVSCVGLSEEEVVREGRAGRVFYTEGFSRGYGDGGGGGGVAFHDETLDERCTRELLPHEIYFRLFTNVLVLGGQSWEMQGGGVWTGMLHSSFVRDSTRTSVDLGEGADSAGRADVEVAGHGGGAHVEPVLVVGRQLLELGQLHDVHPIRHLHLTRPAGHFKFNLCCLKLPENSSHDFFPSPN